MVSINYFQLIIIVQTIWSRQLAINWNCPHNFSRGCPQFVLFDKACWCPDHCILQTPTKQIVRVIPVQCIYRHALLNRQYSHYIRKKHDAQQQYLECQCIKSEFLYLIVEVIIARHCTLLARSIVALAASFQTVETFKTRLPGQFLLMGRFRNQLS